MAERCIGAQLSHCIQTPQQRSDQCVSIYYWPPPTNRYGSWLASLTVRICARSATLFILPTFYSLNSQNECKEFRRTRLRICGDLEQKNRQGTMTFVASSLLAPDWCSDRPYRLALIATQLSDPRHQSNQSTGFCVATGEPGSVSSNLLISAIFFRAASRPAAIASRPR